MKCQCVKVSTCQENKNCKLKIENWKLSRSDRGFTLVEILVVVGIIAILSVAGSLSYSEILKKSRDSKRKADVEQIRSALEMYRTDKGYYPCTGGGSVVDAVGLPLLTDGYIPAIPLDPYNADTTYHYQYIAKNPNGTGTQCYGYCVSANLEGATATDTTCAAVSDLGSNNDYGRKNP